MIWFSTLTQDQIDEIEEFARTELRETLKLQMNDTKEQLSTFYGYYYSACPERFSFLGYKHTISQMVEHVKRKLNEGNDLDYFVAAEINYKKFISSGTIRTAVGSFYGDRKRLASNIVGSTAQPEISHDILKETLHRKAKMLFDKYEDDVIVIHEIPTLSLEMVDIDLRDAANVKGTVMCIFCRHKSKVSSKTSDNGSYSWVLSNVKTHLKNCSKLKQLLALNVPTVIDPELADFAREDAENIEMDINNESKSMGNTTVVLKIESALDIGANSDMSKESTKDDFENSLYTQMSVQSLKMQNTVSMYNEQKEKCVANIGRIKLEKIDICKIDGDGDCAFAAITHQLYHSKINSDQHLQQTEILRHDVVQYVKAHLPHFEHEIKGRILEEEVNISDYDRQCEKFLEKLAKHGFNGGKESLKAIAILKKVNIVVFNEHGPCYLANRFEPDYDRTIFMAFRGHGPNLKRIHYDSVISLSSMSIQAAT